MISTWRTLVPALEDRPLALCDCRSVDPNDLVAADRIIPDRVGEVYYLTHNPKHRWYASRKNVCIPCSTLKRTCFIGTGWKSKCRQNHLSLSCMILKMEIMLAVSFLSHVRVNIWCNRCWHTLQKVCPHVSFNNARKSSNAPPRRSVETRSIVITREWWIYEKPITSICSDYISIW